MIYIYILDSLRYDHVGGDLTPNFNKLAEDGVFFTNAVAQATWSNPSAMAILTGLYPTAVGNFGDLNQTIRPKKIALPVTVETLATLFSRHGFSTSAYSTNEYFSAAYKMNRGFDSMPSLYDLPEYADRIAISKKVAKQISRDRELLLPLITGKDLLDVMWSEQAAHNPSPKHLSVIWTMDTHAPFYDRRLVTKLDREDIEIVSRLTDDVERAKVLYRQMVSYADEQFGAFVDRLKADGKYEDSLIIVLSDHGESFGENYQFSHGGLPFEEQLHIPLIVKLPGNEYAGQRSDALVGLIDILPTLADYYNLTLKTPVDGQSLVSVLRGESPGHEYLMVNDQTQDNMWYYGALRYFDSKVIFRTVNRKKMKDLPQPPTHTMSVGKKVQQYFEHPSYFMREYLPGLLFRKQSWVFDLARDPAEQRNLLFRPRGLLLWAKAMHRFGKLRSQAVAFFKSNVRSIQVAHTNKAIEQRLHDLGYLE